MESAVTLAHAGWMRLSQLADPAECKLTAHVVRAMRRLDRSIFLTEAEYEANPQHKGVNPWKGFNLAEDFDLDFIECDPHICDALTSYLGDYRILDRKFVCGIPTSEVPDWVKSRLGQVANLGAYVRPELRDVTYFHGIDYHQDLIDYPGREADFLTLYVYLTDTGQDDAPLTVLEGSHKRGAAVFPHDLDEYLYCPELTLMGSAGSVMLWHACTLHATKPNKSSVPRVSLRYVLAKGTGGELDAINADIRPLSLESTRRDLDAEGRAL